MIRDPASESRSARRPFPRRPETEPRQIVRRGPVALSDALAGFLRSSGLDRKMRQGSVLAAWSEALPAAFRPYAEPVRFRAGELSVQVRSAAHLHELRGFAGEGVRARANELLEARGKRERIVRVTYRTGR